MILLGPVDDYETFYECIMIELKLDKERGIATVTPSTPLRKEDFLSLAESIDPYIAQQGMLNGLLIHVI